MRGTVYVRGNSTAAWHISDGVKSQTVSGEVIRPKALRSRISGKLNGRVLTDSDIDDVVCCSCK